MSEDYTFDQNLLRILVSQTHLLLGLQAAREMFGKGYFSLSIAEKTAVDQAVFGIVAANYQATTPALMANQPPGPVGFSPPQGNKPANG